MNTVALAFHARARSPEGSKRVDARYIPWGLAQCRVSVDLEHNETGTEGMTAYSRFIENENLADGCEMTLSCARMPSACALSPRPVVVSEP